jgi:hypothetical protein
MTLTITFHHSIFAFNLLTKSLIDIGFLIKQPVLKVGYASLNSSIFMSPVVIHLWHINVD